MIPSLSRSLVALIAALGLASCDAPGGSPPEQSPQQQPSAPAPRAASDSSVTRIQLASGRVVSFTNTYTEGAEYVRHEDRGSLPRLGYRVVERRFYEGGEYVLIHPRSGHPTVVPAVPEVSPGGGRAVVASMDLEAGYAPNLLQIWRATPDSLALEWELRTAEDTTVSGWGASDPTWIDESTIELTRHEAQDVLAGSVRGSRVRLHRLPDGGWSIHPAPQPAAAGG